MQQKMNGVGKYHKTPLFQHFCTIISVVMYRVSIVLSSPYDYHPRRYGKLRTSSLRGKFLKCIVHRPRCFFQISCKIQVARSSSKFAYFLKSTRDYHFVESSLIKIYFVHFLSQHFGIATDANCPSVFQPWDCQNWQGVYLRKPFYILYRFQ